jgi:hypothetical protein
MTGTELDQISADLTDIVTSLLRLSLIMRGPVLFERFLKSETTDTSHFIAFDKSHVESKYPQAEEFLSDRLGKANSQRRAFFKYRQEHNEKLTQGLKNKLEDNKLEGTGTIASSIPSYLKDEGLAIPLIEQDENSDSGIPQTSYATSVGDSGRLRVPSLPKENMDGTPFECPFCRRIIEVNDRRAWK